MMRRVQETCGGCDAYVDVILGTEEWMREIVDGFRRHHADCSQGGGSDWPEIGEVTNN